MFRDKIDQIGQLLTLPEVVYKINEVVESKTASATDLHRVIKADPVLSAKLLRLVNSAYHGLPGQVGSVEKAIILLGVKSVKNLAVASGIEQMFHRLDLSGPVTGRDLWVHCLAVATAARELGELAKQPRLDEVFMAGLIHDVGLLAAAQVAPTEFVELVDLCMAGEHRWAVAELEVLGMGHAEAGARLAERWHFPTALVEMIAHHHDGPGQPEDDRLTQLVYLADTMACGLSEGFVLTGRDQAVATTALPALGLTEQDLVLVWRNLPAHVSDLSAVLRV